MDDDVQMVSLVRRLVERSGHSSVGAQSGEEAIECLSVEGFDLLITDITMGGLSGLELLEAARRDDPDLAVIVVSGIEDPLTAEASLRGGAFGYVVKPFEVTEMQIAVSNALRRRQLEIEQRRHLEHLETEVDRRTEQLRLASLEAQVQEQRFRSLAQASPLGIIYADRDNVLDYCNVSAEVLLGRSRSELGARRWLDELDSPHRRQFEASIREAASGVPDTACEYQLRRPDGSMLWVRSRIAPVLDDRQMSRGVVVLFEDIGDRRRLESQLRHQASHDHLTGLPNRREFRNQLSGRLTGLEPGQVLGVLLVDLDQFKLVNDTYGHEAGDQLIMTVGERLVERAPSDALEARLGGDEYVLALTRAGGQDIEAIAEGIREALRVPVRIMGVELSLSASIGIGTTSDPHAAVSTLLRSADIALHHAKNRRDVIEVFDRSMAEDVARRLALTSDLRRAVDDELLTVHYQPVLDTVSQRLVGLEALARWTHHQWGEIGPAEFIPIAESTGLVHRIDSQILKAAIEQLARWRKTGRVRAEVFTSVNLSASQLSNSALPDLVQRTLVDAGVDGSSLCIEVTEATLIGDIDRAVPILHRLRELGIRIAVDDFGTGHSALSYLGQLPLDVLKIDRSFVNAIGSGGIEVAEAIVDLAHRFDLEVVAEGVEQPHQLDRLRSLGCDMVQGFLLGRPAAADRLSFAPRSEPGEPGDYRGSPTGSSTTTRNGKAP
ncbi:MAG: GGDEF domain-containing response regulator [Acidimicrobiia bacterium]|nr:GGDEF domain-containing response regulator [Acidimicrobiia bacterium]